MPKVDVIDRDDDIVVRAEVAGVDKKDLDISVTESSVTLKGETKQEEQEEQADHDGGQARPAASLDPRLTLDVGRGAKSEAKRS